jgi:AAA domain/UvrD-like helicase C-terminal domain
MSGLLLHGSQANRVRFDAEVIDVSGRRDETDTIFRMVSNVSRKQYNCTASFAIPLHEGDKIVGGGVLELKEGYNGRAEPWVRITQMPMVQADNSKEGLLRILLMKLKGCSSLKARDVYQALEESVATAAITQSENSDSPTSVASWLDETAENFCRDGNTTHERRLQALFPTTEMGRFLKWWHSHSSTRRLYLLGLSPKEVKTISLSYDKAYAILLENPYLLVTLPVDTCERVLQITKVVLPATARRCGEIARQLLTHVQERQWSCTPLRVLYSEVPDAAQFMAELQRPLFPPARQERGYGCVVEYQSIYLYYQHQVEAGFAAQLLARHGPIEAPGAYFHPDGHQPSEDQREAVERALHNGVSCITGEAGAGKSTVITYLRENLDFQFKKWVALSFTGKAVSRIKAVIKSENAFTIHRVLAKELPGVTTAIIDEASMVETPLLYRFLKNHLEITQLIFLGDLRQLLPIGWGSMFTQILQSPLAITRLTVQHRQSIDGDDGLYLNIQQILKREPVTASENFQLVPGALGEVLKLANDIHDSGREVVVLSPVNSVIGELNLMLRDVVNADSPRVVEPKTQREWRLHDRVLCVVNCYELGSGVMNGEEGRVVDLDDHWIEVQFRSGKYRFPFEPATKPGFGSGRYSTHSFESEDKGLDDDGTDEPVSTKVLVLDYIKTYHKVQGSEYEDVIVYVPAHMSASGFFCNNMVYVACSRAKKKCYVVGNLKEFQAAIRQDCHFRYENLAQRLSEALVGA